MNIYCMSLHGMVVFFIMQHALILSCVAPCQKLAVINVYFYHCQNTPECGNVLRIGCSCLLPRAVFIQSKNALICSLFACVCQVGIFTT